MATNIAPLMITATPADNSPDNFTIRIVNIDYYMTDPGPMDSESSFPPLLTKPHKVPIIRIFGNTKEGGGGKCCLHVHQYLPYFYIPYIGSSLSPLVLPSVITKLALSLDQASYSFLRSAVQANSTSNLIPPLVAAIHPVHMTPFYGFHSRPQVFLKIYLWDPSNIRLAVRLLGEGAVLGLRIQAYESHIKYEESFLIDVGGYGMGKLRVSGVIWRDGQSQGETLEKQSWCQLEADTCVWRILNRLNMQQRPPGTDPSNERLVPSLKELWEDESRRRIRQGKDGMVPPVSQIEKRTVLNSIWSEDSRWGTMITEMMEESLGKWKEKNDREPTLEDFFSDCSQEELEWIPNAFKGVEALWPKSTVPNFDGHSDELPLSSPLISHSSSPEIQHVMKIARATPEDWIQVSEDAVDVTRLAFGQYEVGEEGKNLVEELYSGLSQWDDDGEVVSILEAIEKENDRKIGGPELEIEYEADVEKKQMSQMGVSNLEGLLLHPSDSQSTAQVGREPSGSQKYSAEIIHNHPKPGNQTNQDTASDLPRFTKTLSSSSSFEFSSSSRSLWDKVAATLIDSEVPNLKDVIRIPLELPSSPPIPISSTLSRKILQFDGAADEGSSGEENGSKQFRCLESSRFQQCKKREEITLSSSSELQPNLIHNTSISYNISRHHNSTRSPLSVISKSPSKPPAKRIFCDIVTTPPYHWPNRSPKRKRTIASKRIVNDSGKVDAVEDAEDVENDNKTDLDIKDMEWTDVQEVFMQANKNVDKFPLASSNRSKKITGKPARKDRRRGWEDDGESIFWLKRKRDDSVIDEVFDFGDKQREERGFGWHNLKPADNIKVIKEPNLPSERARWEEKSIGLSEHIDSFSIKPILSPILSNIHPSLSCPIRPIESPHLMSATTIPQSRHIRLSSTNNIIPFGTCYFTSSIREMWSPPIDPDSPSTAFFDDPPRVGSPTCELKGGKDIGTEISRSGEVVCTDSLSPSMPHDQTNEIAKTNVLIDKENQPWNSPYDNNTSSLSTNAFPACQPKPTRTGSSLIGDAGENDDLLFNISLPSRDFSFTSINRIPSVLSRSISNATSNNCNPSPNKSNQSDNFTTPYPIVRQLSRTTSSLNYDGSSSPDAVTKGQAYTFIHPAPTVKQLIDSLPEHGFPSALYRNPYFSNDADIPEQPKVFGGKTFKFKAAYETGQDFDCANGITENRISAESTIRSWTLASFPPSLGEAHQWLNSQLEAVKHKKIESLTPQKSRNIKDASQVEAPTPKNKYGFKFSQNLRSDATSQEKEFLDSLSVEVHANSKGKLLPNPNDDPVEVVFWCMKIERDELKVEKEKLKTNDGYRNGMILIREYGNLEKIGLCGYDIDYVNDEKEIFSALIARVRQYDPDILVGYEIHNSSWGYLIERAATKFQINLCDELSRVAFGGESKFGREEDPWGFKKTAGIKIVGRHMLNIWRVMQGEFDFNIYTFENIVFHVLHQRIPHFSCATLTKWFIYGPPLLKQRVFKYYLDRVRKNHELLEKTEFIDRTSEFARIYGIDFFAVISRGSQFRVESVMFRISRPENFSMLSPSVTMVARQKAIECIPLVMEPESNFYTSPLVVLDFQSLYPSIMIAYNYCYSTCLGRARSVTDPSKEFGVTSLELPDGLLSALRDHIIVSPNGVLYVKPEIRKGLLGKMLAEILDTRVMVKRVMKENKDDKALLKLLESTQLGLKLLANVTYGYTGASHSGRMPCVEVADSIVQTGRETLEKAIDTINSSKEWGGRVVYGDTDSVFVYFPGKSREEAFKLGHEIADTITKMNPMPIRLKFEKIYQPAILCTKKRYVGMKYELPDETEPVFEAKGIETVRRDGVPANQKILEQSLKILFRTQDLSQLKIFLQRQWTKIISGRISIQDFLFAQEVRLGDYSEKTLPPGATISLKKMTLDPRSEPQYGERRPYVVVHGEPGARLIEQCVEPEALLNDQSLRLNEDYYINKVINPTLLRIFNLVGADILSWYKALPRIQRATKFTTSQVEQLSKGKGKSKTIDQFWASQRCVICGLNGAQEICDSCLENPSTSTFTLSRALNNVEQQYVRLLSVCASCSEVPLSVGVKEMEAEGGQDDHPCNSMDCPIFFERIKLRNEMRIGEELWNRFQGFFGV